MGESRYDGPVHNIVESLRPFFAGESILLNRKHGVPVLISQLIMVAPEHFTFLENCRVGSPDLGSMSVMVEPIEIWRSLMKGWAFSDNFSGKVQIYP